MNATRTLSAPERFFAKVEKTATCWVWTASTNRGGYGLFAGSDVLGTLAHRFSFEMKHGPIPPGLHIDHLCRNRRCVNPDHLEAVTQRENNERAGRWQSATSDQCSWGHPVSDENTHVTPAGITRCRTCYRDENKRPRMSLKERYAHGTH